VDYSNLLHKFNNLTKIQEMVQSVVRQLQAVLTDQGVVVLAVVLVVMTMMTTLAVVVADTMMTMMTTLAVVVAETMMTMMTTLAVVVVMTMTQVLDVKTGLTEALAVIVKE
jgi:hypothetical protein